MGKSNSDPYAPNWEILINGAKMGDDFLNLIDDVTVEDNAEFISSLSFKVRYQKNVIGGISNDFRDMKFISPGNLVVIKAGYGKDLQDIGAGYIVDLEPDYPENGDPTFSVTCYDQLHKLSNNKSEKGETFKGFRDSQITSIIGERNGFYIRLSDKSTWSGIRKSKFKKTRVQKRGSSDLDFVKELAKLNSFDLYNKWDAKKKRFVLFFEPPKDRTKEMVTYTYGDGDSPVVMAEKDGKLSAKLYSFKPTFSISSQFTEYKVFAHDRKSEKKIEYTLSMDEFMGGQEDLKLGGSRAENLLKKNSATSGAGVRDKAMGKNVEVISKKLFNNEIEAKEYLTAHMKKLAKDFITGNGTMSGNQYLASRQVISIDGVGAFFDGKYFIKKVTHKITKSDYKTSIEVRKTIREQV